MLRIHSLETFGTHEGPGIRFVVFLQGCHLRCLYCHNPDTWKLDGGTQYQVKDILEKVIDQKPYFGTKGGITVSGGEPLIQREELAKLFKECRASGINTTLDTNGSILDHKTKELLKETDLVLLDIKHIDNAQHKKVTGISNYVPLQFLDYLEFIGKKYWIRYVLVPGLTNQKKALHQLGEKLASLKYMERIEILPYHTYGTYKYKEMGLDYTLTKTLPANVTQVTEAQSILRHYIANVKTR